MADNPYQPPEAPVGAVGIRSGSRQDLRSIAQYQKGILACILIYLVAVFGQFAVPPDLRPFLAIAVFGVAIAGAVFVFLLAIKVYGIGLGIVLGVLSLLPLIGLIVLLIVNAKATGILKQNGIKVGLLGAKLSRIT